MAVQAAFNPAYGSGVTVSPGVASASSTVGGGSKALVITNLSSTVVAYVRVGEGSATATTADYPVLPSTQIVLSKAQDQNVVAYIAPAGGGSLHIMAGEGY
jgi:uncharacterized cupin superfamily protein